MKNWAKFATRIFEGGSAAKQYIYPGVNHGFHNDSTPRYDKAAADLAWKRTISWFDKYLR